MNASTTFWLMALITVASGIGVAQDGSVPPSPFSDPTQTESEALPEPDYVVVAEDARKIAAEIEERLIETHMLDASGLLNEADAVQGHPKAEEAYIDMEEMISFCQATAGSAGAACKFKLVISMGLNPGNTLGQLSRSFGPGSGFSGLIGQGAAGQAGSRSRFGMYGPQPFGRPSRTSSRLGDEKVNAQAGPNQDRDQLAGNVEELASEKRNDVNFTADSDGRVLEEYRPLIEGYFKRLAEEDKGS